MNPSNQLLFEYVQTQSQAAFRELMQRYYDLVYSAALRRAGNAAEAQDIAQIVFIDLSRGAADLPMDVQLGGWLHRHTCFVASKHRRSRQRRERHELEKARMSEQNTPVNEFGEMSPLLDEAIDELPDDDRTALILRFFERQEFAKVGQALGATEDAARMRVNRALDKLRGMLMQRGIVIPLAALTAIMADRVISPAPASASQLAADAVFTNRSAPIPHKPLAKTIAAKTTLIAATTAAVLLFGIAAIYSATTKGTTAPTTMPARGVAVKVAISGTNGTPIRGIIVADGKLTEITAAIPSTFNIQGEHLEILFEKTTDKGTLALWVADGDRGYGGASTPMSFGAVRATLIFNRVGVLTGSTSETLGQKQADFMIDLLKRKNSSTKPAQ